MTVLHGIARQLTEFAARTALARPLVRLVGWLSRHRLLPSRIAESLAFRLGRGPHARSMVIRRLLVDPPATTLHLNLLYSGCRDLLLSAVPGAPDRLSGSVLLELARTAHLALDVGANVGLYTCLMARANGNLRVIAFEPAPALASVLRSTVAANGWEGRVAVRHEAVGARSATLNFFSPTDGDTEGTLEPDRLSGRAYETVKVPVVRLADVLREESAHLDRTVLKIDVEGHEGGALDGLDPLLRDAGPRPDIIMEFLGRAIEQDDIVGRVCGYGLSVYYIGPHGLSRIEGRKDLRPVHTLGYWNFWITPRAPAEVRAIAARSGVPIVPPRGDAHSGETTRPV